jgi:hypothetical protein
VHHGVFARRLNPIFRYRQCIRGQLVQQQRARGWCESEYASMLGGSHDARTTVGAREVGESVGERDVGLPDGERVAGLHEGADVR